MKKVIVAAALVSGILSVPIVEAKEDERRLTPLPDAPPDRLCIERNSRYYTSCGSYVGVRFNGEDVTGRVVEFCASDGWVRLVAPELKGKPLSEYQASRAEYHKGEVEPYWRSPPSRQVRRQLARIGK